MKLNSQKILFISSAESPGVKNKMAGLCHAAVKSGYVIETFFEDGRGARIARKKSSIMLRTDAKYVVMRSPTRESLFFIYAFVRLRLQGKILIIDQPSPATTYIKEVNSQARSFLNKTTKKILTYIGCPFSFMLANRIVQYGDESYFFRLFSGRKILLMGNGIDINRISLRQKKYPDGRELLSMIGVAASISEWHGFDRVVKAIGAWRKEGRKPDVTFDIVGDMSTPHGQYIKNLVKQYDIEDCVNYLGYLSSENLNTLYDKYSLAVASLGLFRNGLSIASVLKAREYSLAGIPFVSSGIDPDFPDGVPFRFVVSHDETIDDIIDIFRNYAQRRKSFTDESIRQYAVERLSFDGKFKEIMRGL